MNEDAKQDFPFPTKDKHDARPDRASPVEFEPSEEAIDKGVAESFPASDPLSVTAAVVKPKVEHKGNDCPGIDPDAK